MHVLILGARSPACLEWARVFNAGGWRVTAADSLARPLTRSSHAVHDYVRLPPPRTEANAWIEAISQLVESKCIDVILPTCEEVFYLSSALGQLPKQCGVITSDLKLMQRIHHKYAFTQLVKGWSIEAPETRLLDSPEKLTEAASHSSEYVFKPVYSRFASSMLIRPGPSKIERIEVNVQQPWVAQKFIQGREFCSYSLITEGRLTAHVCYEPLYRVGRGAGIYFKPSVQPLIQQFVETFAVNTSYTGQVGFDFIQGKDGMFHVLECNPRCTSGVHLLGHQPTALISALLGRTDGVLAPPNNPRMVSMAMLLFAAPRHLLSREFWQHYKKARDVIVASGDVWPLLAQVPGLLEIATIALKQRKSLLSAATADIEWNG